MGVGEGKGGVPVAWRDRVLWSRKSRNTGTHTGTLNALKNGEGVKPAWNTIHFCGVCSCLFGLWVFRSFPIQLFMHSAAYMIPFYATVLLVVIPLLYVQLKLGGTTNQNITAMIGNNAPILKGVGIAMMIRLFIFTTFQQVYIAYALFYAFVGLEKPYLWGTCGNSWNTMSCTNSSSVMFSSSSPESAEEEFFFNKALMISGGINAEGTVPWHLAACLAGAWLMTFLFVFDGMKCFGRLMTVLGFIGVAVAFALLAYGLEEMEFDSDIIKNFYTPSTEDLKRLIEPNALDAFKTYWIPGINLALGVVFPFLGVMSTIGKYSGSRHREGTTEGHWFILILLVFAAPHLFLNLLIPYLGELVRRTGMDFSEFMQSGSMMLFVALPAAFRMINVSRGLVFIFYFLFALFGAMLQALLTSVVIDNLMDGTWYGKSLKKRMSSRFCWNILATVIYCVVGFGISIPYITQNGMYLLVLVEAWFNKLEVFVIFFAMIALTICYVRQRYSKCNKVLILIWFILACLFAGLISVLTAAFELEPRDFEAFVVRFNYTYPLWAYILGWFVAGGPIFVGLLLGIIHAVASGRRKKQDVVSRNDTAKKLYYEDNEDYMTAMTTGKETRDKDLNDLNSDGETSMEANTARSMSQNNYEMDTFKKENMELEVAMHIEDDNSKMY